MDLSKRKIKAAIDAGEFEGWDDARLPTLASLRKRVINPKHSGSSRT
jgi:glutamyl/glutaminyl-tRNA synthetase